MSEHAEAGLTDEAEDVSNGGHEDDQHVVEGQDGGSNHHVASPAELSMAEQQCGNGRADLEGEKIRDVSHKKVHLYYYRVVKFTIN